MICHLEERTEIVVLYRIANRIYLQRTNLFIEHHPIMCKKPYAKNVSNRISKEKNMRRITRWSNAGSSSGSRKLRPTASIIKSSDNLGVTKSTSHKILKLYKAHPYKIQLHQNLSYDDVDIRVQFCETMTGLIR